VKIFGKTTKTAIDPVCKMKVNTDKTDLVLEWQGNPYYFCADACRKTFEADPDKFAAKAAKGLWGRYMDRLNKATGGSPPKCCG
jgi:YHS domain-containing protein